MGESPCTRGRLRDCQIGTFGGACASSLFTAVIVWLRQGAGRHPSVVLEQRRLRLEEQWPGLAAARYHNILNHTKKTLVLSALDETNGNYVEAARLLGTHPMYSHQLIR